MTGNEPNREPQNDQIGISHLFDEINYMKSEISEVKQKLNNGVLESTNQNTKSIDNLSDKFKNLSDEINDLKNNLKKEKKYNAWITLISTVILTLLLYWGGFWESLLN